MKSDNTKIVIACIITFCFSCLFNVAASGTLFDSNEVVYNNSQSGLNSTNVQGAVDELYAAATDYSNISSRVGTLESYFPEFTTSQGTIRYPFTGQGINLGVNGNTNETAWIDFYSNGTMKANLFYSNSLNLKSINSDLNLAAQNGKVNVSGNDILINNKRPLTSNYSSWTSSFSFKMAAGSHTLLGISGSLYLLWTAGSPTQVNVYKVFGSDIPGLNITLGSDNITINIKTSSNNTFTAFIGATVF